MTLPPCIYCRSDTPHRTKEHVLQAGFGGVETLPVEVCGDCNAAFSAPDKALMDHIDLFGRHKVNALSGMGFLEDPAEGVRLSVILRLEGGRDIARFPPQAYRHPSGTWHFVGADQEGLASLRRDITQPTSSVSVQHEVDDGGLPIPLTIVRTAPRTFLVRGTDPEELDRIAEKLRTAGLAVDYESTPSASEHFQPKVQGSTSFRVGAVSRAFAKVALNYLCLLFGPETALRSEFDPVRRFARFAEGAFGDIVVLSILNGESRSPDAYADPNRHALVLQEVEHAGRFRVAVQASLHEYALGMVRFPETSERMLPPRTWRVSYFDHVAKSVEHLSVPDDGIRCFANSEAFLPGISTRIERA